MSRNLLTTAEVASLLGVGSTSVKRWAAQGLLPTARTVGRHRRFSRLEVEHFIAGKKGGSGGAKDRVDRWITLLQSDDRPLEVQQALLAERAETGAWWRVSEGLDAVLEEVGQRWRRGDLSIHDEHLVSERLARGLAWCAGSIPVGMRAPRCLLATVEGEEHTLGLSLAEPCFRERGWRVDFVGRFSPTAAVIDQVQAGRIALVGLSASAYSTNHAELARQVERLIRPCRNSDVKLVLGGRGAWPEGSPHAHRIRTFRQLDDLLVGLGQGGARLVQSK